MVLMDEKREGKKHITLIEDEPILSQLILLELNKEGYSVDVYANGLEGLDALKKNTPDLLLLDIMLPGLNGFQILEELAAAKMIPALPVVVISNSGQPVEVSRAKRLGVRDYIIKADLGPRDVLEKVREILGLSQADNAASAEGATQR